MSFFQKEMFLTLLMVIYFIVQTNAKAVQKDLLKENIGADNKKYLVDTLGGKDEEFKQFLYLLHNLSVPIENENSQNSDTKHNAMPSRKKKSSSNDDTVMEVVAANTGSKIVRRAVDNVVLEKQEPLETDFTSLPIITARQFSELTWLAGPGDVTEAEVPVEVEPANIDAGDMVKAASSSASRIVLAFSVPILGLISIFFYFN